LFALHLGQLRGKIDEPKAKKLAQDLAELPLKIEQLLNEAESIDDLPASARSYVKRIEDAAECEAMIVSVGARRDETIVRSRVFD